MIANRYTININPNSDKFINIPINIDFDIMGRDDDIDVFEKNTITEIIGEPEDFEVDRFSHEKNLRQVNNRTIGETKLLMNFGFLSQSNSTYLSSYFNSNLFTGRELYFYANSFTKSFFKLDFYDSPNPNNQTNYLTQIIPTQQGGLQQIEIDGNQVNVKIPQFTLDFIGDKEGFFVYWLKNKSFLNLDTFYVSAKFFNAKVGQFVTFVNRPMTGMPVNFNPSESYYYKYVLDYNTKTYKVQRHGLDTQARVGIEGSPINWFQYLNPPNG